MATVTGYTAAKVDQLIAGVSGGSGVELVSGVVDLDGTGSPVREFYCTAENLPFQHFPDKDIDAREKRITAYLNLRKNTPISIPYPIA